MRSDMHHLVHRLPGVQALQIEMADVLAFLADGCQPGEQGGGLGMGVQNSTGSSGRDDRQMQERFR